jgi:L-fucose isomerase-like protein
VGGLTLGVIIGHRASFPEDIVTKHRGDVLRVLSELEIEPILLDETATPFGATRTWRDAQLCADLFRTHRETIDGILITLPNFGDQKAVADAIRLSGLTVPILVHARPDRVDESSAERRGDAFCGKLSVCNNLSQYGLRFSLTTSHTVGVSTDQFRADLLRFGAICRVVNGMRSARFGVIGTRPNDFNTVRFSEKLFEAAGMSVQAIDLSEVIGKANRLSSNDARVAAKVDDIVAYADVMAAPESSLERMAKLGVVIDEWTTELGIRATAIQCWRSLQENVGVNACLLMSMMTQQLLPSACEADVAGAASMYALQLASNRPSALADLMNNYGDDPDRCTVFHCGNWPKEFLPSMRVGSADHLGSILGTDRTYGVTVGRAPAGPLTLARVSTDDLRGKVKAYVAEGRFTDDPLDTFGAYGVVEIPGLQALLQYVCRNGFEHHAAMSGSHVGDILDEAMTTYLGWEVYRH